MPTRRSLCILAAAALLVVGSKVGEASARSHKPHAAAFQPTSTGLLTSMLTAADEWWTLQGSPPPCPGHAEVTWGQVGLYSEWAFYDSCVIVLSPHWWATQYAFVTGRRPLTARRRAAAFDLALIMHARGHNIGYRHIAGTVMQEDTPVVPGWCFEWAAHTIR